MTLPTRRIEPTQFAKGEKIAWQRTFSDFGASLYDLEYRFRGESSHLDIAATADGDTFVATISGTQSAALAAGRYRWQAWLTEKADSTNTWVETSGFLTVEAGFASGGSETTSKSAAQLVVEACDAAAQAFATTNAQEYEISTPAGTNRVKRGDPKALADLRATYSKIWSQEKARDRVASGGSFAQQIKIRSFER